MMRVFPSKSHLLRWVHVLSGFTLVQVLILLLQATIGLLLVRSLPRTEYAWFTLANSISTSLLIMVTNGLGIGLNGLSSGIWQNAEEYGSLLVAAIHLQRRLLLWTIFFVLPVGAYLLWRNQCPWSVNACLLLIITATGWSLSTFVILNHANRIHSKFRNLIYCDLLGTIVRLIVVWFLWASGLMSAITAMTAALIAQVLQAILVTRQTKLWVSANSKERVRHWQPELQKSVRALWPNVILFVLQGSLTTWLASVFGGTDQVADIGALGRLSFIYTILGAPLQIVGPAFTRLNDAASLARRFMFVLGVYCVINVLLLLAAWMAPWLFLWILGPEYSHLNFEVFLILAGFSVGVIPNLCMLLVLSKGWHQGMFLHVPVSIGAQLILTPLFNLKSLQGLLELKIAMNVQDLFYCAFLAVMGLRKMAARQQAKAVAQGA